MKKKMKTVLLKEVNPEEVKCIPRRSTVLELAASYTDDCKKIIQDAIKIINENNITTEWLFDNEIYFYEFHSDEWKNTVKQIKKNSFEKYGRRLFGVKIFSTNRWEEYEIKLKAVEPKDNEIFDPQEGRLISHKETWCWCNVKVKVSDINVKQPKEKVFYTVDYNVRGRIDTRAFDNEQDALQFYRTIERCDYPEKISIKNTRSNEERIKEWEDWLKEQKEADEEWEEQGRNLEANFKEWERREREEGRSMPMHEIHKTRKN